MFDEQNDDIENRSFDPAERAKSKSDEFRMHAELAAVFEGVRKFDALIDPKLDSQIARDCQKMVARLEKGRLAESPVISPKLFPHATELLQLAAKKNLPANDYHIYRRPGEVMILRWLDAEQVETFYKRLQAHFDSALKQFTEDERQNHGWKQQPQMQAYLAALDAIDIKMDQKYLRDAIRTHGISVLSTQAADEMNISHLCDFIMGVPAAEIVGAASAPAEDDPTDQNRAWFFKLFAVRGKVDDTEQMLFFTFLQKSEQAW